MAPAFLDAMVSLVSSEQLPRSHTGLLCVAQQHICLPPCLLSWLALLDNCHLLSLSRPVPLTLAQASTQAEVQLWEGVVRDSFAALKSFSFLDADKAEGMMKR